MTRKAHIALIATAALALTGCGSTESPSASPVTDVPTVQPAGPMESPTPTPTADRNESPRGNLIKSAGVPFGYGESQEYASFVVSSIEVAPTCTGHSPVAPANGHFVKFDIEGETASDLGTDLFFGTGAWTVIAENGTTFNGDVSTFEAYSCLLDNERLPDMIGPGEKVSGSVILDVPTPSGVAVLDQAQGGAWEWAYPNPD